MTESIVLHMKSARDLNVSQIMTILEGVDVKFGGVQQDPKMLL